MKSQFEKNKEALMEKIDEYSQRSFSDSMAEHLAVYCGALTALLMQERGWDSDKPEVVKKMYFGAEPRTVQTWNFSKDMASAWTAGMVNEDGTKGPHWSFDQAKQLMAQKGIGGDPNAFFVALNMIYSDYCKAAKKLGLGGNTDFYVEMAQAFLNDKDAGPDKLSRYYEYIVK